MREGLERQHEENDRIRAYCELQRFTLARQRHVMRLQQNSMPDRRPPKDPNQLAKYILDVTTGDAEKIEPPKKNPAAVELGRRGGIQSAKTRNQRLSPAKRRSIAKKAAKARWK